MIIVPMSKGHLSEPGDCGGPEAECGSFQPGGAAKAESRTEYYNKQAVRLSLP